VQRAQETLLKTFASPRLSVKILLIQRESAGVQRAQESLKSLRSLRLRGFALNLFRNLICYLASYIPKNLRIKVAVSLQNISTFRLKFFPPCLLAILFC
jgi:hypothetical protein